MKIVDDLLKRPTFASVISMACILLLILLVIYQTLFVDLGGGASLGIALEIIGIFILGFIIGVDRILLTVITNRIWLSIIEAVLIIGYLTNYYITHNNSFSIG
jgi:hypothetical protein